jgi:hypothetical protein
MQVAIKVHPRRLEPGRTSLNYDIGLIKLDRTVIFGPDLSPICLKVAGGGLGARVTTDRGSCSHPPILTSPPKSSYQGSV